MRAVTRRLALFMTAASAAVLAAPAALAQAAIKLSGSPGNLLKRRKRVAVPAYHVTFIMQQQATAVAGIGARTRLNTVLTGISEQQMRRLTDEAYADLVAKLKAAGVDVVSAEEARSIAAGVEAVPGNRDIQQVGPTITIGKSIKAGWAAFGASEAPLLKPYHNPGSPTGATGLAALGANGKLGGAAKAIDASALIPALTIDYADMEAKTGVGMLGGAKASVGGTVQFSLRAVSSATLVGQEDRGAAYAMGWRMTKDLVIPAPFAAVDTGGAGVREGSMTAEADENYVMRDRARGDAIRADPAAWEGLVRQAFTAFNTAVVGEVRKAKA